jgi:hypothetical protein
MGCGSEANITGSETRAIGSGGMNCFRICGLDSAKSRGRLNAGRIAARVCLPREEIGAVGSTWDDTNGGVRFKRTCRGIYGVNTWRVRRLLRGPQTIKTTIETAVAADA